MKESAEAAASSNKYATPALILGIIAAVFYELILPSVGAIILGALGLDRSKKLMGNSEQKTGKGLSIAGLTLGLVYLFCGFIAWTTDII